MSPRGGMRGQGAGGETPARPLPWPALATAALGLAALYLAFGAFQIYDYDTPLHLLTGEYLLRDPASAGVELFSYPHLGYPWLNDKWLENVLVHLVDAAGGAPGLVALRMALVAGLAALAAWAMAGGRRPATATPWGRATSLALLGALPLVAYERFTLRPELFTLLGVALMLGIGRRDPRGRGALAGVLLLHAAWVNIHGYWIVGPLILTAFLAGDLVERLTAPRGWPAGVDGAAAAERARRRIRLLFASLAGALLSPHPAGLFLNPFRVLRILGGSEGAIGTIAELRSPFHPNIRVNFAVALFYAAGVLALAALAARPRRLRPAHAFLLLGFFAMAAANRRNIGMFAVTWAVVSAWCVAGGGGPAARGAARRRGAAVAAVAVGLAAALGAGYVVTDRFYIADGTSRRTGFSMSQLTYPGGLADALEEIDLPGPFFNDFASGSYLAYRLYPRHLVYITGNTFKYPAEFFDEYSLISLGGDAYRRAAEKYGLVAFAISYVTTDMMPLAQRLFNDSDYAVVHFDDNGLLFVHRSPETERLIADRQVDFVGLARRRAAEAVTPSPAAGFLPLRRRVYPRGEMNRAGFLSRVGAYPLAEVEYRRALRVDPGNPDARHGLGDSLLRQGKFQESLQELGPLRAADPRNPHLARDAAEALSGLGSQAAAEGSWAEARRWLEEALQALEAARSLDPGGDPMREVEATDRFNLGYTLLQLAGSGDEPDLAGRADRELDAAVALAPDDGLMAYRLARIRARQGRGREALELLGRALRHGPPELRPQAGEDPSFAALRADPAFRALLDR